MARIRNAGSSLLRFVNTTTTTTTAPTQIHALLQQRTRLFATFLQFHQQWNEQQKNVLGTHGVSFIGYYRRSGQRCLISSSGQPPSQPDPKKILDQSIASKPLSVPHDQQVEQVDTEDNNHDKNYHNNKTSSSSRCSSATSDPAISTWVNHYLPPSWQPFARLARMDKPIGTWLLLWPCYWSTALATPAGALPDVSLLALFGVGAFTMRGAGCTMNDMWDRKYDAAVQRTQTRPLAAGDITLEQAWAFLALQLTAGLGVLVSLPHTWYCFQWGAASLPLVIVYPITKRFFPYPQLFLGLTFNWGAWMGWAATHGSMNFAVVAPLYLSGVTWTLVYDTIYAHQDKDDDARLKLQSTALSFGSDPVVQKGILHGLGAVTALQWIMVGLEADLASIYYAGVATSYGHLVWQIHTADLNDPHNLAARFRSNSVLGGILFGSLVAGKYLS